MNLADAIRKAATDGPAPTVAPTPAEVPNAFQPKINEGDVNAMKVADPSAYVAASSPPEPPSLAVLGGNVVRIELFMSAEQTTTMLKAIMTGQHTILTLAEAAHYLRVRPQTLAKMADDGEIRAVEIDSKWRFPKHHLDEWLYSTVGSTENDEENQDVA